MDLLTSPGIDLGCGAHIEMTVILGSGLWANMYGTRRPSLQKRPKQGAMACRLDPGLALPGRRLQAGLRDEKAQLSLFIKGVLIATSLRLCCRKRPKPPWTESPQQPKVIRVSLH